MSQKENGMDELQGVREDLREYVEKRFELLALSLSEQLSLIIAHAFQRFIGVLVLALAFITLWFGVAYFLGELIGRISAGFAISSVPLLIAGFILFNQKSTRLTERIQANLIEKVIQNFDKEKSNPGANGSEK